MKHDHIVRADSRSRVKSITKCGSEPNQTARARQVPVWDAACRVDIPDWWVVTFLPRSALAPT
jgi:hypothetical protein